MNHAIILQVEDDENDVLLLRYAFEKGGLRNPLRWVPDGQEAIDWLAGEGDYADRSRFPLPCLVLLDLKMPRKNGFDVLRWVRAQPGMQGIVVVVLSASPNQADVDEAYRLGANAFAIKPAGTDQLAKLVQALRAFWIEQNRFASVCARRDGG